MYEVCGCGQNISHLDFLHSRAKIQFSSVFLIDRYVSECQALSKISRSELAFISFSVLRKIRLCSMNIVQMPHVHNIFNGISDNRT